MWGEIAQFGPWVLLAALAIWRGPAFVKVVLQHRASMKKINLDHEHNLKKFEVDLGKKRAKIQKRVERREKGGGS